MSAYKQEDINTAIVNILKTVEDPNAAGQKIFQDPDDSAKWYIYDYATEDLDGTPAVVLFPTPGESEYATVVQNERAYAFFVAVVVDTQTRTKAEAYKLLRQVSDGVMNALDKSIDLNGACDFLEAVPTNWANGQSNIGEVVYAPLRIVAKTTIPLV